MDAQPNALIELYPSVSTVTNLIGKRIKEGLVAANKKAADLARALDTTPQAVGGWIKTGRIDKKKIPRVAKFLGLTTDQLLGYDRDFRDAERADEILGANPELMERWPFHIEIARFDALSDHDKGRIEGYIEATIAAAEAATSRLNRKAG